MAKKKSANYGHYAFIAGIVVAILAGIFGGAMNVAYTAVILVLLGLLVGILNVTRKEVVPFLVAAIALMTVGTAGLSSMTSLLGAVLSFDLGEYIAAILTNFVAFVAPAALVVAIKAVWTIEEQ